jgi:hypothetical protein
VAGQQGEPRAERDFEQQQRRHAPLRPVSRVDGRIQGPVRERLLRPRGNGFCGKRIRLPTVYRHFNNVCGSKKDARLQCEKSRDLKRK